MCRGVIIQEATPHKYAIRAAGYACLQDRFHHRSAPALDCLIAKAVLMLARQTPCYSIQSVLNIRAPARMQKAGSARIGIIPDSHRAGQGGIISTLKNSRTADVKKLADCIRNIPDFPRPGIQFKDITPLLKEPTMLRLATGELVKPFAHEALTAVAGVEARGFIFAVLAAQLLNVGFVPLRKPGKLPDQVQRIAYELEYGTAELENTQQRLE